MSKIEDWGTLGEEEDYPPNSIPVKTTKEAIKDALFFIMGGWAIEVGKNHYIVWSEDEDDDNPTIH